MSDNGQASAFNKKTWEANAPPQRVFSVKRYSQDNADKGMFETFEEIAHTVQYDVLRDSTLAVSFFEVYWDEGADKAVQKLKKITTGVVEVQEMRVVDNNSMILH